VQCSIIVTHHSTQTDQTEKLLFIRTLILGLIASISTYLTNLPHRQLMWETWLIQSNGLYTKFHVTQWYSPVFALFSYMNMWDRQWVLWI